MQNNKQEFILVNKKIVAENITSLYFKPAKKINYKYVSGQYVIVKPNSVSHGKAYTISSTPKEKYICLTIKKKGEVSSAMIDLKIGEKIIFEGPYGYFYPEKKAKNIVMFAGSIGVTPFYSIIKSRIESNCKNESLLFYSNKSVSQTPFFEELNKLSQLLKNL